MNRLKLSDFMGRKNEVIYVDGIKQIEGKIPNGKLKFLTLGEIGTAKINKVVKRFTEVKEDDKDFVDKLIKIQYDILKLVTDIDVDVDLQTFIDGVYEDLPYLVELVKDVQEHFNRLRNNIIEIAKQLTDVQNNQVENKEVIIKEKTSQEKLIDIQKAFDEVQKAWKTETDTYHKHDLFVKMSELMGQIDKLEQENSIK